MNLLRRQHQFDGGRLRNHLSDSVRGYQAILDRSPQKNVFALKTQ